MAIFKNLFGYSDKGLSSVMIGHQYAADKKYRPSHIIAQAFGASYESNSYNQILAETVEAARAFYNQDLTAIVQSEIGVCLKNMGASNSISIGEMYDEDEKSLVISKITTKEVLGRAKEITDDLNLQHSLFIGHPYHMQRILDRSREVGLTGRPFFRERVEWPKHDPQLWVRSPYFWVPREIIGRLSKK